MTTDDAVSVPWLAEFARSSPELTFPRLMTAVRPGTVGSFGPEAIAFIEAASGRALWPWQRLAITRALEHDADRTLVWRTVTLTVPRQTGKSTLVGELASWRMQSGHRFAERQVVLHVARDLGACVHVQTPHRRRAQDDPEGFKTRAAGGRLEIENLVDGSQWLIRSSDGVYSYTTTMVIVDEGWDVAADAVDAGLAPTMLQSRSPQLWLVSTANQRATSLFLGRRAQALAELAEPGTTLWMEWSCPADADVGDPGVWRATCPRWTAEIAERYADQYVSAVARRPADPVAADPVDAFAAQYLNRWPSSVEPVQRSRGEPLVDMGRWAQAEASHEPQGPIVIAVERHTGADGGVSVVCAGNVAEAGCVYLEPFVFDDRASAYALVRQLVEDYPGSRVVVGEDLVGDPGARDLAAQKVGASDARTGITLLREELSAGRVAHWCAVSPCPLSAQLGECRVNRTPGGALSLFSAGRTDAVRAALWALGELVQHPVEAPAIF